MRRIGVTDSIKARIMKRAAGDRSRFRVPHRAARRRQGWRCGSDPRALHGSTQRDRCTSNVCMKLSFEAGGCQCVCASGHFRAVGHRHGRSPSRARMILRAREGGETVPSKISPKKREERPMDFNMSDRQREWLNRVQSFMHKHVRPAVPVYRQQDEAGGRWKVIPVLEDLKKKARAEGLWNMFMPPSAHEDDEFRGAGLSNLEY